MGGADHSCVFKIGRVRYRNEIIVGRVSCNPDDAVLYIAHKNREYSAKNYEILVYSNESVSIDYGTTLQCKM